MTAETERARLKERIRLALDAAAVRAEIADHVIRAPAKHTSSIQEMHSVIGHMLCGFIEEALC
jgi:D-sedoheptulose 7-phosphate isomerase